MRNLQIAQSPQEGYGSRKRPGTRKQVLVDLTVTMLQSVDLVTFKRAPDFARDGPGEQPAAHPDPAVDAPAVDRHARLSQRLLPGEHVGIDGVDERPVEIEDERAHGDIVMLNAEC